MHTLHKQDENLPPQNLQIWFCEHCQAVHFKTGNVILNFTRREFVEMAHAVLDIYAHEFDKTHLCKMIESFIGDDDVLLSQTIV